MEPHIKIVKSYRKSIVIQIESDGSVLVKAPKLMLNFQINRFIEDHREWIEKHVAKRVKQKQRQRKSEYLYLGNSLKLNVGRYTGILAKGGDLLFPEGLVFRKEKEINSWYIQQAKIIISKQVEYYAEMMKTSYREITYSDTRSQWGRCTHDNRLQFNWRLVMAPLLVINYVVIHELAHTMEKNHTQMFWMKVRGQMPSYRQQIKWLKENGASLRIY